MPWTKRLALAALCLVLPVAAAAEDYALSLEGKGLRDYYCQITVALENRTDAPLTEISGYFNSYVGDQKVGRSKGSWFLNVGPGARAEATFETPNAPCDAVEQYEFVVGACRIGTSFEDKARCAGLIDGMGRISVVAPGGS